MKPVLERIKPSNDQSFYLGHYEQTTFRFPWHYHPEWELTYIIEGSGMAYSGNRIRHFVAGELALVGPNLPHCWKSSEVTGQGVKSVFAQWDQSLLGENWLAGKEFSGIAKLLEKSRMGVIFHGEECAEIGAQLQVLNTLPPLERLLKLISLLDRLTRVEHTLLCQDDPMIYQDLVASKRIENILNFVAQNYSRRIVAEEMAELVSMTPVSFSKYFSKTFNKPFTAFLNEYRISQACELLVETEYLIEDIAERCGYQNMAFFHRQFKQVMEMTPLKYRTAYRKAQVTQV